MSEVTAEMIERGRLGGRGLDADRRRVAAEVREARERLTSSGSGHRAYDVELLKLYAQRRKASVPGLALLSLALAAVALRWTMPSLALMWLSLSAAGLLGAYGLADTFLGRNASPGRHAGAVNVKRWIRVFTATEGALGALWAVMVVGASGFGANGLGTGGSHDPQVATFLLVALLLFAAMNATVTATVPSAVYGTLTPMTVAIIVVLQPRHLADHALLLTMLALGTEVYFVALARRLRAAALQALVFQAEKDDLIGELEQSKANSDLARRRAEESNLAKSRFLATMSHELRTPLNAILGFSEVMKAELFGAHAVAAYKDYASDIHSSGEHLLMLINEILDLSRVEAGRYELREESVDLQVLVDECRHLVTLRAKKKDIALQQEVVGPLPRLWVDERAVRQVALNLLSNAIKFTPQGGQVRIKLGASADGGQYFAITDTGVGIPAAEIPIVMSSFGRGTQAQKNAEEGTGLGLPIVKGLVELHGGTFTLTSVVRQGTEVSVRFPPERVMNALPRVDVEAEAAKLARPARPMRSAA